MSAKVIGQTKNRVDGKLKVTGRAIYPGDRQMENLGYGYLLTSAVAKGSIQSMDTSVAERSPGVAAVYTPFNPLKLYHGLESSEGANSGEIQPPLQDRKVLNYGQIIGLVVANSFEQARDAAALVKTAIRSCTSRSVVGPGVGTFVRAGVRGRRKGDDRNFSRGCPIDR